MKKSILILFVFAILAFGCAGFGASSTKDCGSDENCFKEAAKTCSPAKLAKSDDTNSYTVALNGFKGDKCSIYMKIVDSKIAELKNKEMTCNLPKEFLTAGGNPTSLGGSDFISYCSGSLVDLAKGAMTK